jgi:hypothetical protein
VPHALLCVALVCASLTALAPSARAEGKKTLPNKPADTPVLVVTKEALEQQQPAADLLTFKGTVLINEFVYRTKLKLPPDAAADAKTAHLVAEELAAFLLDSGFDLAKVRAEVKGAKIEVTIDEGALDKIVLAGAGWLPALRFRAALNLPLDVFNRRQFESELVKLAAQLGFKGYRYELWPVQLLDDTASTGLEGIAELQAMPLLRPARAYELRVFAETEPWSSGFSPEIILNGQVGLGLGGRYKWRDLLQTGDRWQAHFRVGGQMRGYIEDPNALATQLQGSRLVNSLDYLTARWLSKAWGGGSRGLRMTVNPRFELWTLQRKDLFLESFRIATLELGVGAGAQLLPEYGLYFTAGMQRRWIFDKTPAINQTLPADVTNVRAVANRAFLKMVTDYTFNTGELRRDLKDFLSAEIALYRPMLRDDMGYLRVDLQGKKNFLFGWNELRAGLRLTAALGDINYADELPLGDHLRIGFGLDKYTYRVTSLSLEYRYSITRDRFKVGLFTDAGIWRHLKRDDPGQFAEISGSTGAGMFFFIFDELQIDFLGGVGWSTDGFVKPGINLAIKEAF